MPIPDRRPRGREIGSKIGRNLAAIYGAVGASYGGPELEQEGALIPADSYDTQVQMYNSDAQQMLTNNGQTLGVKYPRYKQPTGMQNLFTQGEAGRDVSRMNFQSQLAEAEANERRGLNATEIQSRKDLNSADNTFKLGQIQKAFENEKALVELRQIGRIDEIEYQYLRNVNLQTLDDTQKRSLAILTNRLGVLSQYGIASTDEATDNEHYRALSSSDLLDSKIQANVAGNLATTSEANLNRGKNEMGSAILDRSRSTLFDTGVMNNEINLGLAKSRFENLPFESESNRVELQTNPELFRNRAKDSRYKSIGAGLFDLNSPTNTVTPLVRPARPNPFLDSMMQQMYGNPMGGGTIGTRPLPKTTQPPIEPTPPNSNELIEVLPNGTRVRRKLPQ